MKRIISGLATLILSLSTLSALPSYAVVGDANNDGVIDVSDVVYIRMHLVGSIYVSNQNSLSNMDFTNNGLVSQADIDAISAYIMS